MEGRIAFMPGTGEYWTHRTALMQAWNMPSTALKWSPSKDIYSQQEVHIKERGGERQRDRETETDAYRKILVKPTGQGLNHEPLNSHGGERRVAGHEFSNVILRRRTQIFREVTKLQFTLDSKQLVDLWSLRTIQIDIGQGESPKHAFI
jgi:hypothetical protein